MKKTRILPRPVTGRIDEATLKALEEWMSINNFENKMRKDGKIWGTVYRFLLEQSKIT
ncbi:MAG: hypothetical protein J7J82_02680 [Staphylothermus sp.]|nr:hypothetical protein [Staphylothermus sp.]